MRRAAAALAVVAAVAAVAGATAFVGASAADCVEPTLAVSPQHAPPGSTVTLAGRNFWSGCYDPSSPAAPYGRPSPDGDIHILFADSRGATQVANVVQAAGDGSFGIQVTVPAGAAPGSASFTAQGTNGAPAAPFTDDAPAAPPTTAAPPTSAAPKPAAAPTPTPTPTAPGGAVTPKPAPAAAAARPSTVTTAGSAALGAPSTGPTTTTPLASVPTFVPGLVTTTSVVGANDPAVLGTTNGLAAPSVTIAQSAAHSSGAGAGPVVGMLLVIGLSCAAAVLYLRRARPLGGERGWSR